MNDTGSIPKNPGGGGEEPSQTPKLLPPPPEESRFRPNEAVAPTPYFLGWCREILKN